jgi:hypothetical protein
MQKQIVRTASAPKAIGPYEAQSRSKSADFISRLRANTARSATGNLGREQHHYSDPPKSWKPDRLSSAPGWGAGPHWNASWKNPPLFLKNIFRFWQP